MTPLHGIACFCDIGFGARAVSRKTPIYFMIIMIMGMVRMDITMMMIIVTMDDNFYHFDVPELVFFLKYEFCRVCLSGLETLNFHSELWFGDRLSFVLG